MRYAMRVSWTSLDFFRLGLGIGSIESCHASRAIGILCNTDFICTNRYTNETLLLAKPARKASSVRAAL